MQKNVVISVSDVLTPNCAITKAIVNAMANVMVDVKANTPLKIISNAVDVICPKAMINSFI